jgi:hypothetical protein
VRRSRSHSVSSEPGLGARPRSRTSC